MDSFGKQFRRYVRNYPRFRAQIIFWLRFQVSGLMILKELSYVSLIFSRVNVKSLVCFDRQHEFGLDEMVYQVCNQEESFTVDREIKRMIGDLG